MKNKKGNWLVKAVIVILFVGILVFIIIPGVLNSSTLLAGPRKMLGIGTEEKNMDSSAKSGDCTIKRFYWSKEKAKIGETVDIIVEGNENCNDKKVNIHILKDLAICCDQEYEVLNSAFKENKIMAGWIVKTPSVSSLRFNGYYFKVNLDAYASAESTRLKIE